MPATEATSNPAGASERLPDFRLNFSTKGGMACGDGVYEWMTVFNARGGPMPRGCMLLNRHNGDLVGKPVGLFSDALPVGSAKQLVKAMEAVITKNIPATGGGDARANTMKLEYQNGTQKFAVEFNAMNRDYLGAIGGVIIEMQKMMTQLLGKPERAVVASVERAADAGQGVRFQLRLTNIGTQGVMAGDPRIRSRDPNKPRGVIKIAPAPVKKPGEMEIPPRWQPLGLEGAASGTVDSGVTIQPNESLVAASLPWIPPQAGEYVVQGVWMDCAGAAKADASLLQAAIPAGVGPEGKMLMLRGAAFSKYLRVVIPGR
jgi:hypothetical protein